MRGVKYIGPVLDASGYSEAARNYVLSIYKKGYPITVTPISFEKTRPNFGEDGVIINSLINKNIEYDKVIVHSTPDLWQHFTRSEKEKHIIGYTVWETSKLHPTWVEACNWANEVWVPSDWNMAVFRESGVVSPLYKIPHAIKIPDLSLVPEFEIEGISNDIFVFYSIFQWQERKNPYGLLSAYLSAFTKVDDVVLILKTYRQDHAGDKEDIRNFVVEFRRFIRLPHYPKIFLVVENMSSVDITALHKRGDAFILLQRSEGWGLPHMEAAACGKPVITPSYGGQVDFLKADNSYLIDYTLAPVGGMGWSQYYLGDQYWCEPNIKQAIDTMRYVYNNREEARLKGLRARDYISENFTWSKIGNKIIDRLTQIDEEV